MRATAAALVLCVGGLLTAQQSGAGVVAGTVVDAQGALLEGVSVQLLHDDAVVQTVATNSRGEFQFRNVAPGVYVVRASPPGLVPAAARLVVGERPMPPLRLAVGIPLPADSAAPPPAATPAEAAKGRLAAPESVATRRLESPAHGPRGHHTRFDRENYSRIDDNRFRRVTEEPLSTFSIDVDTASYSNVRRFLNEGRLPPPDAVRVEELINYFRFDYADATEDRPFSVTAEMAACPWNPRHTLALIGLQARRHEQETPARNLVFLLDVSGSMMPANKLPLVKTGMRLLVDTLTAKDRVAIVVYAGASGLVLPSTPGNRKAEIHGAIEELRAGGSTNGGAGIELAYDTAAAAFVNGGVNRVILATDGDFNVGITDQDALVRLIERKRERGIFLSVLGVGTGNIQDSTMEKLADKGNGNYAYLDSLQEARRVLIEEAGATLVTVAKDVKIQVEFNPRRVGAYRLVGYENRVLNAEDFNDDRKDAGEIGAGHTVTALYELVPPGESVIGPGLDQLIYQQRREDVPSPGARQDRSGELMTVKVRYKQPDGDRSERFDVPVRDRQGELTPNLGFAAAVAQFGMLLRQSGFKGRASWSSTQALARQFRGPDPGGYRAEFVRLLDLAAALEAQERSPSGTGPWRR